MAIIRVDMHGFDQISDAFAKMRVEAPRSAAYWVRNTAEKFAQLLKENAPYQDRPDPRYPQHLRDSFTVQRMGQLDYSVVTTGAGAALKYNWMVGGTRPHIITPRFKKYLWWPDLPRGTRITIVHHPGTAPNPFDEQAFAQLRGEIDAPEEIVEDLLAAFQSAFRGSSGTPGGAL